MPMEEANCRSGAKDGGLSLQQGSAVGSSDWVQPLTDNDACVFDKFRGGER